MATYYSTFIPGFEPLISELLAKQEIKVVQMLNGAVLYQSNAEEKIRQYKFFNNTFSVLDSNNSSKEQLISTVSTKLTRQQLNLPKSALTFRLITSEENKTINLEDSLFQKLVTAVKVSTGLKLVSGKADIEFWLITRREGITLFAKRLTKRQWNLKTRQKGSLPTELAYLLCIMSEPKKMIYSLTHLPDQEQFRWLDTF